MAALEAASENGLENLTMSKLAQRLGIQKPSLYNHFSSKEELINEMYRFLRERAKRRAVEESADYVELARDRSMEEVLTLAVENYAKLCGEENMLSFYRLLYSRRAADPAAAQIMTEETERMILETRRLFYALCAYGKMKNGGVDTAALSFAMTVHALLDYQADLALAGKPADGGRIKEYISWFCGIYAADDI